MALMRILNAILPIIFIQSSFSRSSFNRTVNSCSPCSGYPLFKTFLNSPNASRLISDRITLSKSSGGITSGLIITPLNTPRLISVNLKHIPVSEVAVCSSRWIDQLAIIHTSYRFSFRYHTGLPFPHQSVGPQDSPLRQTHQPSLTFELR